MNAHIYMLCKTYCACIGSNRVYFSSWAIAPNTRKLNNNSYRSFGLGGLHTTALLHIIIGQRKTVRRIVCGEYLSVLSIWVCGECVNSYWTQLNCLINWINKYIGIWCSISTHTIRIHILIHTYINDRSLDTVYLVYTQ